jgi:hypothetical protein
MLHKPVRFLLLNVALTVAIIALGHALSYVFG